MRPSHRGDTLIGLSSSSSWFSQTVRFTLLPNLIPVSVLFVYGSFNDFTISEHASCQKFGILNSITWSIDEHASCQKFGILDPITWSIDEHRDKISMLSQRKYIFLRKVQWRYNRTPFIRINWDDDPSGYPENPDNWIFLWKCRIHRQICSLAGTIHSTYLHLNLSTTPDLKF